MNPAPTENIALGPAPKRRKRTRCDFALAVTAGAWTSRFLLGRSTGRQSALPLIPIKALRAAGAYGSPVSRRQPVLSSPKRQQGETVIVFPNASTWASTRRIRLGRTQHDPGPDRPEPHLAR